MKLRTGSGSLLLLAALGGVVFLAPNLSAAPDHPVPPAPSEAPLARPDLSEAEMVAGIHSALENLEAEVLMRFVHTPDFETFERIGAIIGDAFRALPDLAPYRPGCPDGTVHICSMCSGHPLLTCEKWFTAPMVEPDAPPRKPQTQVQMLAGLQASMSLLEAEVQARFIHTPNARYFRGVMGMIDRAHTRLGKLMPEGMGSRCPAGTTHINSMCVAEEVLRALRERWRS